MDGPLIRNRVAQDYPDYLRDESRRTGRAEAIAFPRSEEEVREVLRMAAARGLPVTLQGSRTGITGGAVPDGGLILNLSRMTRVLGMQETADPDTLVLTVEPGLTLEDLRGKLARGAFDPSAWTADGLAALERFRSGGPWFFAPDPTETTASIGGMVACNASGACSFHYGPTRRHVQGLGVVLAAGDRLHLRRGLERLQGRAFRLVADSGRVLAGHAPGYALPAVKNASGYFVADDMDAVDLFIGAEGTLGVVTAVELRVMRAPSVVWGGMAFVPSEAAAVRLVHAVRERRSVGEACLAAVEFFDRGALTLLRQRQGSGGVWNEIPPLPPAFHTAVYAEYHGPTEDSAGAALCALSGTLADCGGDEDRTWIATEPREMEKLKRLRHAVPEAVNLTLDERRKGEAALTKLGTDMAVPDDRLEESLNLYHGGLDAAGLEYVIFGHIGNSHLHVNVLPRSLGEYDVAKALYLDWARRIVRMGGTVSAEHGVGKFKVALLREMFGEEGIAEMRRVKRVFDPGGLLNRGNLFPG
jgi:D-lactate dehydrogenase (cytochrome)